MPRTDSSLPPEPTSYEQARDELERIVQQLENGTASLDESLALWERAEALAQRCEQWLDGARTRLADQTDQAGGAEQESVGTAPTGAPAAE